MKTPFPENSSEDRASASLSCVGSYRSQRRRVVSFDHQECLMTFLKHAVLCEGATRFLVLIALFLGFVASPSAAFLQATGSSPAGMKEYQIKAAFLFNFAQFIGWPQSAFQNSDAPLRIGILGEDPFERALQETVHGETINNRRVILQHSRELEDLMDCQILFIGRSERRRAFEVLSKLNSSCVLTVGEIDGFARRGGIINFYFDGNKLRFEINATDARRKGLKISSQLLGLGKIVEPELAKED